jgi:glycosyltransferase involved in cell wall biosynthesis
LPIITTENCGLPLEQGKSAIYIPANDRDALAEAISRASADQGLREQIGRNAMRLVTENYTWLHYGQKVSGYFKEAVEASALHSGFAALANGHVCGFQ